LSINAVSKNKESETKEGIVGKSEVFGGGIRLFGPGTLSPGLAALDPYAPQEYREQKMVGTDIPWAP